jgi:ribonuclease M5
VIKLKYPVAVEGKYDKIKLSSFVSTPVFTTEGFGIFRDENKSRFFSKICNSSKLIILTDSDKGGDLIRKRLKSISPNAKIVNLYIPQIKGKEKRKKSPSKQGYLGVEGMDEKLLTDLFTRAGLVDEGIEREPFMDRAKLYSLGLMGKDDSAEKRKKLAKKLGLYEELSTTSFLESLNLLCSEEEFVSAYNSLDED